MNITKILSLSAKKKWLCYLACLGLFYTQLEAVNDLFEIRVINDSQFNSLAFSVKIIAQTKQIYQSTKAPGESSWGPEEIISDPTVAIQSYEVKKDSADNICVTWIGENTDLGIYCLYLRFFTKVLDAWSPIYMISDTTQNLVGNFSSTINTLNVEVVWSIYTEDFSIENRSATINLID